MKVKTRGRVIWRNLIEEYCQAIRSRYKNAVFGYSIDCFIVETY